jgi:hypothetical protein
MLPPHLPRKSEDGLPPADVRFVDLHVEPWPDGRRIRIHFEMTPFQQPPSFEAWIADTAGETVSHAEIIEIPEERMVFTMHIRSREVSGLYQLTTHLYYPDLGVIEERQVNFETHETTDSTA